MTSGIQRGFKTQFEMWGDMLSNKKVGIFKAGKKEAQSFAEAVDMVTGQRAMLFSDIGDMFGMTSKIEGMMGKAANFNFMYVNLMSRWTEFMKGAASVTIGLFSCNCCLAISSAVNAVPNILALCPTLVNNKYVEGSAKAPVTLPR